MNVVRIAAFSIAVSMPCGAAWAEAENSAAIRGKALAERLCAQCYAIGEKDSSPFTPAPPFRAIMARYPAEALEEAFAEGIAVGHPAMPVFEFSPDLIADLIAWLETLEPEKDDADDNSL